MPKNILVLGAQKDLILPKIKVDKLYAANGAITLVDQYLKANISLYIICVTASAIYLRHEVIRQLILNSKPNKFVIRGSLDLKDIKKDFDHNFDYICFDTKKKILNFQKKFFKKGLFSIYISELYYENFFFKKILHFLKTFFLSKNVPGVSTGFFSLLLALEENPDSTIIISGISMKEGGHFFKKKKQFNNRARIDQFLIHQMKDEYKKRIFTTDLDQSKKLGLSYFLES